MMMVNTTCMCRELLMLKDMATLTQKRQEWLKAARDLSTLGRLEV